MMLMYCTHPLQRWLSWHCVTPECLVFVCLSEYVELILSIVSVLYNSGRVAKEVMEQSAKIKREPPEIHR